jgi:hypothetical protein
MVNGLRSRDALPARMLGIDEGKQTGQLRRARLRHIAGTAWSTKRYLNTELPKDQQMRGAITA